ncbi:peptidylprolyl isomerase [Roseivivax sediminis]|uniref:Parvulin-like PPIase n=1 Tax=Roseivivax sediminis TaxID=936889 RepID=A0A1I1Y489_9RHOB|nr:peptidylprolyl isomerase [Roseivivax sediminis]SFE13818.1 periplasmic chaperone for outer membrane proteins SurA [Roseivivax sediminis]
MPVFLSRTLPALIAALMLAPVAAPAQNLFAPAIRVNDAVITNYELQQRAAMLELLNSPGNAAETARDDLIDDRLRLQAARSIGVQVTEAEILEGMEEFAGRADLSREEFLQALTQGGIAEETFRDFVRAGVAWRSFVRQRFPGEAQVFDVEVDRAIAGNRTGSNIRVLLSEIIIPAPPPQAERARAIAEEISTYTTEAQFSAAAREYSATQSRENGGRLPWQDIQELPPVLRRVAQSLSPGEVSDPLPITNGVALFQLRGIEETGYTAPEIAQVDYATYLIPGGLSAEAQARARVISSKADRCDDLYGIAKGQPANVLERRTAAPSQLPDDIAIELSKLDPGETSAALTRSNGQTLMMLMLCSRDREATPEGQDEDARRDEVRLQLRNRRVGQIAERYLADLRANAYIAEE